MNQRILVLAALFWSFGCSPDTPSSGTPAATGVIRSDSAGVEIVEVPLERLGGLPLWRLAAEPAVSIGDLEGEAPYLFHDIRGAVRLSDGRIVVLDGSNELRFFDASGRFLQRRGGRGEGPGEYLEPALGRKAGDTLIVWDRLQQRTTVLAPDGELIRTESLERCPGREDEPNAVVTCPRAAMFLDDGTVVSAVAGPRRALLGQAGPHTPEPTLLFGVRSGAHAPIATLHEPTEFWVEIPTRERSRYQIFGQIHGGRPTWWANGERVVEARTDSSDVRFRLADGRLLRILRLTGEREPVTEADIQLYRDNDWGNGAESAERWLAAMPPAETKPLFGSLRLDEVDRLWMREYVPSMFGGDAAGRSIRWTVFASDGRPLGRIDLPGSYDGGVSPRQIDEDAILGVTFDELGVQRVVLYSIER